MQTLALTASRRTATGKGVAKKLRRTGMIPAVCYGRGHSTPIVLDAKVLQQVLRSGGGSNTIFQLNLEGETTVERKVMAKELQHHPLSRKLLHADLLEIAMDRTLTVQVPVELVGEPDPVKQGNAILNQILRELSVVCLPALIPEALRLDVSTLKLGEVRFVRDIAVPEGVRILEGLGEAVVAVNAVEVEEKEKAEVPVEPVTGAAGPEVAKED